ncbi:MAG: hypothetical protein KIH69_019365 [Anaerolineae bacterium]|nr:hypothetical protein [Anaerolineae bacterium]
MTLETLPFTRIVATPAALDAATWPAEALALRTAADEVLLLASSPPTIADPHAIVVPDSGFVGTWLPAEAVRAIFEQHCEWALPAKRPVFMQGAIAGIAAKVWLEAERGLLIVPAAYKHDFAGRMAQTELS